MKNLLTLLTNDFRLQFNSQKYVVILIFSLIIGVFISFFQTERFNERALECNKIQLEKNKELYNAVVYSEVEVPIVIPPNPMSIFAKGVDEEYGSLVNISFEAPLEFTSISQKRNPFLLAFESFDIITIVQLVLSLLTIFLVSDTISSEKEYATIKDILSNPVSKIEFLVAKFLSSMVLISIPLLSIFLIQTIFLSFIGNTTVDIHLIAQISKVFLVCLLYLMVYVLVGMIVSYMAKTSIQSLVFSVSIWLFFVIVLPNTIKYLTTQNQKERFYAHNELKSAMGQLDKRWVDILYEFQEHNWPKDGGFQAMYTSFGEWGIPKKIGLTRKPHFEFYLKIIKELKPNLDELNQEKINLIKEYYENQYTQFKSVNKITCILPEQLLMNSCYAITATGFNGRVRNQYQYFQEYRRVYLDFLKQKDAFSYKYFTQIEEHEMRYSFSDYDDDIRNNRAIPETWNKLDLSELPVYEINFKSMFPKQLFTLIALNLVLICLLFICAIKIKY